MFTCPPRGSSVHRMLSAAMTTSLVLIIVAFSWPLTTVPVMINDTIITATEVAPSDLDALSKAAAACQDTSLDQITRTAQQRFLDDKGFKLYPDGHFRLVLADPLVIVYHVDTCDFQTLEAMPGQHVIYIDDFGNALLDPTAINIENPCISRKLPILPNFDSIDVRVRVFCAVNPDR